MFSPESTAASPVPQSSPAINGRAELDATRNAMAVATVKITAAATINFDLIVIVAEL